MPGGRVGFGVGLRELVADRVEIEQIARRSAARGRPAGAASRGRDRAGSTPSTSTLPLARGPVPCSAHNSDDLPGAVAAHQRDDLAARAARGRRCAPRRRRRIARRRRGRAARPTPSSTAGSGGGSVLDATRSREPVAARRGIAHRQRQRIPVRGAAELDDRRRHRRRGRRSSAGAPAVDGAVAAGPTRRGRRTARPARAGVRPSRR